MNKNTRPQHIKTQKIDSDELLMHTNPFLHAKIKDIAKNKDFQKYAKDKYILDDIQQEIKDLKSDFYIKNNISYVLDVLQLNQDTIIKIAVNTYIAMLLYIKHTIIKLCQDSSDNGKPRQMKNTKQVQIGL